MHKLKLWLVLSLLAASFLFQYEAQAEIVNSLEGKRVLLLLSYDPLFPSSRHIIDGITETLAKHKVKTHVRYLHSKSIWNQGYRDLLADFFADLGNTSWLESDLVITADDNAFSFMRDYREKIFGNVPWVFLGVNDERKVAWAEAQPYVSGLYEAPSFVETLDLAVELFPSHNQIHVISDATPSGSGSGDYNKLLSLVDDMQPKPRLNSLSLVNHSWVELKQELEEQPAEDPILLISAYKDSLDERKLFDESLKHIVEHANGPIFHMWRHGLGEGVFGGVMIDPSLHGAKAAEYALGVLRGEDIASLPVEWESPNKPEFDWVQLGRFDIPVKALPEQSIYINRQASVFQIYQKELFALMVVGILLVIFITLLLLENRRRVRTEERLRIEKALLTSLSENTPDLFFFKDKEGVYQNCNSAFEVFVGRTKDQVVGNTDYDLFDKEVAAFFRAQDKLMLEQRKARHNREWVTYPDGRRAFLDVVKFPNWDESNNISGLVGISRDITKAHERDEQNRLLAKIFDCADEGMMICNIKGRIIEVNPAFTRITGYSHDLAVGESFRMLISPAARDTYIELRSQLIQNISWQGEISTLRADGSEFTAWFIASPVTDTDDANEPVHYIGTFSDISQIKETQDNLNYRGTPRPPYRHVKPFVADSADAVCIG